MAQARRSMSTAFPLANSTKEFGVYLHKDLSDPTGADADLVAQAPDFNSAYSHLLKHTGQEISSRPKWGVTRQGMTGNTYEVLTWDGKVLLRYSTERLRDAPQGEGDSKIIGPAEHYGMFASIDIDKKEEKTLFVSGFTNPSEASHALKTFAQGFLAQHEGAKLMERSVELLDGKGVVRQRYVIVKGQSVKGKFVPNDEDWSALIGDNVPPSLEEEKEQSLGIKRLAGPRLARALTPQVPTAPMPAHTPTPMPEALQAPQAPEASVETWCTCGRPDSSTFIIACENDNCPIQWYQGACLGIHVAPEGDWWCPTCAPAHALKKGKNAKTTKKGTGKGRKGKGKSR